MDDPIQRRLDVALARLGERGLTRKLGFGSRPAVVVVDFSRAFTDASLPLAADFGAEIAATTQVLAAARAGGHPVYFTTVSYEAPDLADAGIWAIKVPATTTMRAGTANVEIDARLGRRDDEAVIVKKYASAFFGTDLASRLTARGIDTIVLCGCTTSGCVRASAVDGLQHGFRVMVALEAVGDRDADAHVQSLLDMQAKYADVVTVAEVAERLAGRLAGQPA
jgi:nicotinamidase-related amidase